MAVLTILAYPDPRLNNVAKEITTIDNSIQQIADDMFATMQAADGVGLAATQVNIDQRIIVINSIDSAAPLCLINPVITKHSGTITWEEGCLSFPRMYTKVKRFAAVTVEFQDLASNTQVVSAEGLFSVCLQHEIDHLQGITFYDRISPLRQQLLKKKLKHMSKR